MSFINPKGLLTDAEFALRLPRLRILLPILPVVAVLFACRSEGEPVDSGAQNATDSLSIGDSALLAEVDSLIGLVVDSAAIQESAPPYPLVVPDAPLLSEKPVADSEGATSAELADLRAQLTIPVAGVLASDLVDSYSDPRVGRTHQAIDILAPRGTAVLSATDGRLTKLHQSTAGGLMVYAADANDRFVMMYGHLDRYAEGLSEGMSLSRGQILGYVGTTGNAPSGTPHLHFSIARGTPSEKWWKGTPVNPYELLMPKFANPPFE